MQTGLKRNVTKTLAICGAFALAIGLLRCASSGSNRLKISKHSRIVLVGGNLGSRMMDYGHFETEVQMRYPDSLLYIRNMSDAGNSPGFRPHSGRNAPWAFPGAEKFQTELANDPNAQGHFETPDEWIARHRADIIVALFGTAESFGGPAGRQRYTDELDAFVKHTLRQRYNGRSAPQLALVSPTAFEDLSATRDLPNGDQENRNIALYAEAMKTVAKANGVLFVDMYRPFSKRFAKGGRQLTVDGMQLNDEGYREFAVLLADALFGKKNVPDESHRGLVHAAVMEKNWMWHKDFKMPNGVQAFGRRYDPFGPDNYPAEIKKIREMTTVRDEAIWRALKGEKMDIAAADARTTKLPEVETNYVPDPKTGIPRYLYGEETVAKIRMAPGYKIELFASEQEFPDLEKPMQLTFDNAGRLWVAIMPSYPHWKPGDPKPNDKILVFEDTDGDGRADKQTIFADGLHLPVGFEIAPEGVYVSQGTDLILLTDTDGDGRADKKEVLLSGFDDHDTHHAHHAYTADPSGAIYMGQGVFLVSDVETPYGVVRATNGGFFRYDPTRQKLEFAKLSVPNPWGIAFDEWGQHFYAETSGPDVSWMMPGTVRPIYGKYTPKSRNLIEEAHKVRPTSGLEFISSRHFPDEVQGDMIINNTIGFLGTKQHALADDGTGYKSRHRQDLLRSADPNFRPVDMEFAPDGSLFLIDWHNVLIGHMQHNQRDPLRDHTHGRIYRVTYPDRPLVRPAYIADAPIDTLLDNLKLHEYRSRYRTRRELRAREPEEVLARIKAWTAHLDKNDPRYEHHLLEALWVSWGLNRADQSLLRQLLRAKDYRARAAAVRVVRYTGHQLPDQADLLTTAAADAHGRVRLEALVAASYLDKDQGLAVLAEAARHPLDDWMKDAYGAAMERLSGDVVLGKSKEREATTTHLTGADLKAFRQGEMIYWRDGFCSTCHQSDGKGLPGSGYPPLVGSPWLDNDDRLIKLTLNGLLGPMELDGHKYSGQVPMTPFAGLLDDGETAAVLTYVKNAFGNCGTPVSAEKVKAIRAAIADKKGFYTTEELLKEHPLGR